MAGERPQDEAPTHAVRLGRTRRGGIAPSIFALVERGAGRHPLLAAALRGTVLLRFAEGYPPVLIRFGGQEIVVSDEEVARPDVEVRGSLPDVVLLTTTRLRMGVPDPADGRGRAVLSRLATGRVRLRGDRRLATGVLDLLHVAVPRRSGRVAPSPPPAPEPGARRWIDVLT
jgi:hypothetical protein